MSSSVIFLVSVISVGAIAGLTLDVLGLLVIVAIPSLLVAIVCATIVQAEIAWYVYPSGWILQQAAYFLTLVLGRGRLAEVSKRYSSTSRRPM